MVEVREVLRAWLEGHGLKKVAERAEVDRKTARRYAAAAVRSSTALSDEHVAHVASDAIIHANES